MDDEKTTTTDTKSTGAEPKDVKTTTTDSGPMSLLKIVAQRAGWYRHEMGSNHSGDDDGDQVGVTKARGSGSRKSPRRMDDDEQAPPPPTSGLYSQPAIRAAAFVGPGAFCVAPGQEEIRRGSRAAVGSVATDNEDGAYIYSDNDEESIHRTAYNTRLDTNATSSFPPALPATLVTDHEGDEAQTSDPTTFSTRETSTIVSSTTTASSEAPTPGPTTTGLQEEEIKVDIVPGTGSTDCIVLVLLLALVMASCLAAGVLLMITSKQQDASTTTEGPALQSSNGTDVATAQRQHTNADLTTLEKIRARGYLRCAYFPNAVGHFSTNPTTGEITGFDAALCQAIAAGILGNASRVEYVPTNCSDRFPQLARRDFDVLTFVTAKTMGRQLHEVKTGVGFEFTVPFLYDQVRLGGDTFYIDNCVDRGFHHIEECSNLRVCVPGRETSFGYALLKPRLPRRYLVLPNNDSPDDEIGSLYDGLLQGRCNVIVYDSFVVAEPPVRRAGYKGPYKVAETVLAGIPYSMVTNRGDARFSDMVNAIVLALQAAEEMGVTQQTAREQMPQTDWFGDDHRNLFRDAIAAGGNLGELYKRHVEQDHPRERINHMNNGSTGLLYPLPLNMNPNQPNVDQALGPALTEIVHVRGYLRCGVRLGRPGFATVSNYNHSKTDGDYSGMDVDYCRAISAGLFGGNVDSIQFVHYKEPAQGFELLANHQVDVVAGAEWTMENDFREPTTNQGYSFSPTYFYYSSSSSSTTISRDDEAPENVALATLQDDPEWTAVVYWIVMATFHAEANYIGSSNSTEMPEVNLLGTKRKRLLRDAIWTVGSYAELYERNLEPIVGPRSNINQLNRDRSPQFYVPRGL